MSAPRERALVELFVGLADTMVDDYDVMDLLDRLVAAARDVIGASDAGILLRDDEGILRVAASTNDRSHVVSLLELDAREGPCVDAVRTARPVSGDDIATIYARWPSLAVRAGEMGYQAMHAVPMRLREEVLGSLNLFSETPGPLAPADLVAVQGLADIATIGILHERALRHSELVREQLQTALSSRVVIEQAKGALAQSEGITTEDAFQRLRGQARSTGRRLSDIAAEVVDAASMGAGGGEG